MEKEFVPYELAVKLKELGFDEPCLANWSNNKVFKLNHDFYKSSEIDGRWVTAPTFSQAFRWFREKNFLIDMTSINSDEYEFYIKWSFEYSFLSDHYKTYEEAELGCLEKLIEIVEMKKEILTFKSE